MSHSQFLIIIISLAALIVLMLVWSIIVVPLLQRKSAKKREDELEKSLASFKEGDKILLASGIRALFIKRKGDILVVKISENVKIKVDKHSIMGVYK